MGSRPESCRVVFGYLTAKIDADTPNFEISSMDQASESNMNDDNSTEKPAESSPTESVSEAEKRVEKLLSRPIPPRRNRGTSAMPRAMNVAPGARPGQPVQTTPAAPTTRPPVAPTSASPDPHEQVSPVVASENAAPIVMPFTGSSENRDSGDSARTAELQEELGSLRLQLEASQQELMHVSAARDQALSVVSQNENQVGQLQQKLTQQVEEHETRCAELQKQLRHQNEEAFAKNSELEAKRNLFQQERDSLTKLVEELKQKSATLETELADARANAAVVQEQVEQSDAVSSEAVLELESKHQQTIDELRTVIGQREAAEASMARERDALAEQMADLQRKFDAQAETSQEANEQANPAQTEALATRITELEKREYQISSELSLANETVRQLNQNLSQRDARFMQLQQQHDAAQRELASLKETAQAGPSPDELTKLSDDLATARKDLESVRGELAEALDRTSSGDALRAELEAVIEKREQQLHQQTQMIGKLQEELVAVKKKQDQTSMTPGGN